jgi:cysteine synthase A
MHYLFIESNTTGTGAIAIDALLSAGHRATFLTRDRNRYPFLADVRVGLRIVEAETNEASEVSRYIRELMADDAIDGVATFSTFYVSTVAVVAADLGLPFLNERTARICHDKIAARRALEKAHLPNPAFWEIADDASAARAAAEVPYPCVMKPAADSGSTGVLRIENKQEFLQHYHRLTSQTVNERGQSGAARVLVEDLLEGPEVSVESFTFARGVTHVAGITKKYLSPPPYFVEVGHDFPADLSDLQRLAIENAVTGALEAVGYDFGPAHTEVRLTPAGPVIVEINPRLAGGMIPELVRLATGVDLISAYLSAVVGEIPILLPARHECASIRFITAHVSGTLIEPVSFEDLLHEPLVQEISLDPRRSLLTAASAADRLGFVICAGPDAVPVRESATTVAHILSDRIYALTTPTPAIRS